jgi:hypothetical protein
MRPASGDALHLDSRSHVTVDGFYFEDGKMFPSGSGSVGNVLRHFTTRETTSANSYAQIWISGGTDLLLEDFDIFQPVTPWQADAGPINIGADATAEGQQVVRAVLRNGIIRGGRTGVVVGRCKDCVFDGVTFAAASNHNTSIGIGRNSALDVTNLTFKNSMFLGGAYPEPTLLYLDNDLANLECHTNGLTLLNNAFLGGFSLPAGGHSRALCGTVVIRNNVFYGPAQLFARMNNDVPVTWSVDYNAYYGAVAADGGHLSNSDQWWHDERGAGVNLYTLESGAGDGTADTCASCFNGWQTIAAGTDTLIGQDAHSIAGVDSDYRTSPASYAVSLWGTDAPLWAFPIITVNSSSEFVSDSRWLGPVKVDDYVEYNFDGIKRQVSAMAGTTVTLSPAVSGGLTAERWLLSWGDTDPTPGTPNGDPASITAGNRGFTRVSPINGDTTTCAHLRCSGECAVGPGTPICSAFNIEGGLSRSSIWRTETADAFTNTLDVNSGARSDLYPISAECVTVTATGFPEAGQGSGLVLRAQGCPGYAFAGWSGDCADCGTSIACAVGGADNSCVATFTARPRIAQRPVIGRPPS